MAFSLVTGQHARASGSSTSLNVVLPSNPTAGNLVVIPFLWFDGVNASSAITSIKDANNNSYTVTPNSPSSVNGIAAGTSYLAYLLSAPANADKTVTIIYASTPAAVDAWIMEFHSSVGNVAFDTDIAGHGGPGLTVNTPTVTPTRSNELLVAHSTSQNVGIKAVVAPWVTPETLPTDTGDCAAYILSASAGTALNFTNNESDSWDSIAMAFYEIGSAPSLVSHRPFPFKPSQSNLGKLGRGF